MDGPMGHAGRPAIDCSTLKQRIQGTKHSTTGHQTFYRDLFVQVPAAVGAGGGIPDQATPLHPE